MPSQHVLVLNCGSSSFKFAIIAASTGHEILSGLAERLGDAAPSLKYKFSGTKTVVELPPHAEHKAAILKLVDLITELKLGDDLVAVGHRVVHGGEAFTQSILVDGDVLAAIQQTSALAPLHNPANLLGIDVATSAFKHLPQIAVFDTAFHQTMPEHAYLYALPYEMYQKHGIRRYGFHGTSHCYVSEQTHQILGLDKNNSKIVTAHLGNGCSVTAIKNGRSVDTSMGLTPLEGLVMGTRSGDIDPGLFAYLSDQLGYSSKDIDTLLNKQSGLLGISALSNDCRTIEEAAANGHKQAQLALEMFCFRLAKYIASFAVSLGGLDALVFTGGIGENSDLIRQRVIEQLAFFGMTCDHDKNQAARFGHQGIISTNDSNVIALVVPTNEEWVIAKDAARITKETK
ncbi:acetate/propionate family kinase [Pseudoalteromonas xiamenensis]|uniref:acetate/propionate family kinase n=1 Tax=Pseudoalteromonas xiamenensis TaxID=882626 RepID=UPI0035EC3122